MIDQYRLRLRDGTILAVDHDGLRTWVLDDKAMVQPAGSRGWRPLRETLVLLERARAAADVRRAEPPPEPTPREAPPVALPLVPPPPRVDVALPLVPPPPRRDVIDSPPQILAMAQPLTTIADSIAPETASSPQSSASPEIALRVDALPIIPFKPLEEEEQEAFYVTNAPPEVEVEDREDERVESAPAGRSLLDVASAEVDRHARDERPWQWSAPEPREVPGIGSLQRIPFKKESEEDLEELEELQLVEDDAAGAPLTGSMALREMFAWVGPLASSWRNQAVRRAHLTRPRMKRGLLIASAVAAAVVAVSTVSMWVSGRMSSGAPTAKVIPVPPPPAREEIPELPKGVQAVMDQAPHLAPETVQLLLSTSTSYGVPDAPEVFRRAYAAAERGTASLTREEALELRGLTKSVLAVLGPGDRKRVLAYGRLSSGRHLLSSEDRRVLGLFARGVRTLPPTHRERLQTLTGKAIAAAVTPPTS